jgi:hypothetical protein
MRPGAWRSWPPGAVQLHMRMLPHTRNKGIESARLHEVLLRELIAALHDLLGDARQHSAGVLRKREAAEAGELIQVLADELRELLHPHTVGCEWVLRLCKGRLDMNSKRNVVPTQACKRWQEVLGHAVVCGHR